MRRAAELALFAALAALLHLAALQPFTSGAPVAAGAPGGGWGGGAPAMSGATAELTALVESWDRAPETTTADELAVAGRRTRGAGGDERRPGTRRTGTGTTRGAAGGSTG